MIKNNYLFICFIGLIVVVFIRFNDAYAQESPEQIFRMGLGYLNKGSYEDAVNYFTQFLASYPENVRALNYRGLAYESLKNYTEALNDFSSAIQLSSH